MLPKLLIFAMAWSAWSACKENAKPKEPAKAAPLVHKEVTESDPPRQALAPVTKQEVEALTQTWLDAQNSGNFEAYADCYAERLTGIKRVGSKKRSFDRDSWLKDRQRMFQKKMSVQASDLVIRNSLGSATARFEQSWSSGSFQDVGPKQLVIVREHGQLKIAREEMLSSAVLSSSRTGKDKLDGLLFAAEEIDGFIVQEAKEDWATGPARLEHSDPYIVTRAVSLTALPPELRSMQGKAVTVYGDQGSCADKIASFTIVVGITPHFGFFQDEEDLPVNKSDDQLAADLFAIGSPYLVADLAGRCHGKLARFDDKREILSLAKVSDKKLEALAEQAFSNLPEYQALQEEHDEYLEEGADKKATWDEHTTLALFDDQGGQRHVAVVAASGGSGCGEFYGSLSAVFVIDTNGKLRLLGSAPGFFRASSAMDLYGDGRIQFIGTSDDNATLDTALLGTNEGSINLLGEFGWDYQDCPC